MKKLAGFVASSSNPEDISKRIKGGVVALSALIMYVVARFFNIDLTAQDVIELGTQLGVMGGALFSLYGAGIALINKFARK